MLRFFGDPESPGIFTLHPTPRTILTSTSGSTDYLKVFRCNNRNPHCEQGVSMEWVVTFCNSEFLCVTVFLQNTYNLYFPTYLSFIGEFWNFPFIQHCFICRPPLSRRMPGSNPGLLRRWHWHPDALTLDQINFCGFLLYFLPFLKKYGNTWRRSTGVCLAYSHFKQLKKTSKLPTSRARIMYS